MKKVGCVIVGAGESRRFKGSNNRKQFLRIDHKPLLYYTLKKFESTKEIKKIVLVLPCDGGYIRKYNINYWKKLGIKKLEKVVKGGSLRTDSVYNGLNSMKDCDIILIHDGVRPGVSVKLIERVIKKTGKYGACIPVIPVQDTVKMVGSRGLVRETLDRKRCVIVQTPQGFKREIIFSAYQTARKLKLAFTDDSAIVENVGFEVKTIKGEISNIKVTYRSDIKFLTNLL